MKNSNVVLPLLPLLPPPCWVWLVPAALSLENSAERVEGGKEKKKRGLFGVLISAIFEGGKEMHLAGKRKNVAKNCTNFWRLTFTEFFLPKSRCACMKLAFMLRILEKVLKTDFGGGQVSSHLLSLSLSIFFLFLRYGNACEVVDQRESPRV